MNPVSSALRMHQGVADMSDLARNQSNPSNPTNKSCVIKTIQVWLKGFIPAQPTDHIKPLPNNPGKMMITIPNVPGCFSTDNRSFSDDPAASARMTSFIEIEMKCTRALTTANRAC